MSQSPVGTLNAQSIRRYRQGWQALNQLLHEGRSFSGNERNCAFLNLGGQSFADVSGLIGFNFADDARAVISTDWDFDGDIDLWTTARTAPRVRFLRNNSHPTSRHFLGLRLTGDGVQVNRDAIGARAELFLAGNTAPLIQSVRAGDAFLSQTGQWLTFQFPANRVPVKLEIHWPGGPKQTVTNPEPGQFYTIVQEEPAARWTPPESTEWVYAKPSELPPERSDARIVLTGRLPLPPIHVLQEENHIRLSNDKLQGPLLVNLWAPWCQPCLEELRSWSEEYELFRDAGLRILTLNTDAKAITSANRTIRRLNLPFEPGHATPQTVRSLDWFQRSFLDSWKPLPVPSSFLIDRNGEVATIYKGPVAPEILLHDLNLLERKPPERREAAVPFPGRWLHPPRPADPLLVNAQFVAHDELAAGLNYLEHFLRHEESNPTGQQRRTQVYVTLGRLQSKLGQHEEAKIHLRKALRLAPTEVPIRQHLARALLQSEIPADYREAINTLQSDRSPSASDRETQRLLSEAYLKLGLFQEGENRLHAAEESYRYSLQLRPSQVRAAERLGWLFATRPDSSENFQADALAIARRLCTLTKRQNPAYLDLLSVAQAANGEFDQAIQTARAAQQLRTPESNPTQFKATASRIEQFTRREVPQD